MSDKRLRGRSLEPLPPREFIKAYPLPQVGRIHEGGVDSGGKNSARVDLRQPFLLYKSYSSVKVHARSVRCDTRGRWREVGPTVVIPEDYTGWFSLVTDNGRTASYFTSIEQVANAHVPYFLVRNEVPAYKVSDPRIIAGKTTYTKTTVKTGHVLKLLGVYEDVNGRHYKNLNKNHKSNVALNIKYAQCVNYKGEVLFLSFAAQGKFYATATRGSRSINHVYLMSQLLRTVKLPITIRLVCGFLPKIPCNFTGNLKLLNVRQEEVVLACTLFKECNVMLEMDANSGLTLSRVPHDELSLKSDACLAAMAFCADEADIWRRQMKVVHYVYQEKETTRSNRKNNKYINNNNNNGTNTNGSSHSGSGSGLGSGSSSGSGTRSKPDLLKKCTALLSSSSSSTNKHEVQSVCISMIFDEMDEDEDRRHDKTERRRGSSGGRSEDYCLIYPRSPSGTQDKTRAPTKFWTLRRLKQLAQNESACEPPYAVVHSKEAIYEVVDDGSENANAEFTSKLNKEGAKWYHKLLPFDLPNNGTYIFSQKNKEAIYDSIC